VEYDVLDVDVKQFDDDFYVFRCSIKELERRLGSVLNQGFDDCATVFAAFKLIESFEGLLEREFIQADLERKHLDLLKAYANDLRDVQDTFSSQKTTSDKEQMSDASQTPNPLDACLKDGRDESFANCLAALELCNRSLSDYLETKRRCDARVLRARGGGGIVSRPKPSAALVSATETEAVNAAADTLGTDREPPLPDAIAEQLKARADNAPPSTLAPPASASTKGPVEGLPSGPLAQRDAANEAEVPPSEGKAPISPELLAALTKLDDPLIEVLDRGDIRLLLAEWLLLQPEEYLIQNRQELEKLEKAGESPSPLLTSEEAVQLIRQCNRGVGGLSYGWLSPRHPDPAGKRVKVVRQALRHERYSYIKGFFWECALPPAHASSESLRFELLSPRACLCDAMTDFGAHGPIFAPVQLRFPLPRQPFDGRE